MLLGPNTTGNFQWKVSNISGTRPAAAAIGTNFSLSNNLKGAWVEAISAATLTRDAWALWISVNSVGATTVASDAIMDVGIDITGGSNYTVLLPDLLISCAGLYNNGGGVSYYFPIRVPAGSSIAIRGSVNSATAHTASCAIITAFGSPADPSSVHAGTYCTSFGINTATSGGTAVTSGTASDGAWTQLGSALTRPHWWWQLGFSVNNAAMNTRVYNAMLGVSTVLSSTITKTVICDKPIITILTELCITPATLGAYAASVGQNVYGRLQCSSTPDTGIGLAAWGIGG